MCLASRHHHHLSSPLLPHHRQEFVSRLPHFRWLACLNVIGYLLPRADDLSAWQGSSVHVQRPLPPPPLPLPPFLPASPPVPPFFVTFVLLPSPSPLSPNTPLLSLTPPPPFTPLPLPPPSPLPLPPSPSRRRCGPNWLLCHGRPDRAGTRTVEPAPLSGVARRRRDRCLRRPVDGRLMVGMAISDASHCQEEGGGAPVRRLIICGQEKCFGRRGQ